MTPATIIIRGTALTRAELGGAADGGRSWCGLRNAISACTAKRPGLLDALDVGLPLALGADWLPSGSMSLLAEMNVVRHELINQGHQISARDLVNMVTADAARIAALDLKLGTRTVGATADVVVVAPHHD